MKTINSETLKGMLNSGANNLYNHHHEIDQLNVFPVPDGDTGLNMNKTVTSGIKEISKDGLNSVSSVAAAFSKGTFMAASGNSGVITSQIFKGFAKGVKDMEEITAVDFARAMLSAKETAYKAVMNPVEGTILTVIRMAGEALNNKVNEKTTIEEALEYFYKQSLVALEKTPDLLPVLKEVGVVDSGGAGLCKIIEGMLLAVKGEPVERSTPIEPEEKKEAISSYAGAKLTESEEGYGYCTQFIVRLGSEEDGKKPYDEAAFIKFLSDNGNSLVTVREEEFVKVHVHTLKPGTMLNFAQQYGEFVTIVIENMSEEHDNISHGLVATDMEGNMNRSKEEKKKAQPVEMVDHAMIAVSSGAGLDEIFSEIGVAHIVSGGQTMNPSVQDFIDAVKAVNAKDVYILPNNSNIILAASQAADVLEGGDTKVHVIPTKTIPQGLAAAMQLNPAVSGEENVEAMSEAIANVRSGSVTYAIRDTNIDGIHVTKDYYMAMKDKKIVSCVKNKDRALYDLIDSMVDEDALILTLILGSDVSEEEEEAISSLVQERYGDTLDVDIKRGDQPVYPFIVSVEC